MNDSEKSTSIWKNKWFRVLLISFVIALTLRTFFIESYRMPSLQMENTVLQGDYIFVDKTAYGIRLPMTWLSIPFVADSISLLKMKTYSGMLSIPYKRIFGKNISRNDVVLYNIPSGNNVPLDKSPLSISRCVGLPGDSIESQNNDYYINGEKLPQSPDLILAYGYPVHFENQISQAMQQLQIPVRKSKKENDPKILYMSRFEAYSLREILQDSIPLERIKQNQLDYKFFIPKKGSEINISDEILRVYQQIILEESEGKAEIKEGTLCINNRLVKSYTFKQDYYWMLSDNTDASADSRHFGFISEKHILGKATLVWFSKQPTGGLLNDYRLNRIFVKIN